MSGDDTDRATHASGGRDNARPAERTDVAVGRALRAFRNAADMTIRRLSEVSGVSAPMISRIESGQVSPSLSTLETLGRALDIPIISFFRHTVTSHDVTHVPAGGGLVSERIMDRHAHQFRLLGYHKRQDIRFEPLMVRLVRNGADGAQLPRYEGHGCEFIHMLEGEALYAYGEREFHLREGDSLSFDAAARHGFARLLTPVVRFISVMAQRADPG